MIPDSSYRRNLVVFIMKLMFVFGELKLQRHLVVKKKLIFRYDFMVFKISALVFLYSWWWAKCYSIFRYHFKMAHIKNRHSTSLTEYVCTCHGIDACVVSIATLIPSGKRRYGWSYELQRMLMERLKESLRNRWKKSR